VIAISAAAVAVACALMAFARFGLFRDSGPGLAIGAAIALAAILTLTPVLLRAAGGALFWPGTATAREPTRRLWAAIARGVVARPAAVLFGFGAALAPLVWQGAALAPSFELELDLPTGSASERGWHALTQHFAPAAVSPLVAAIALPDSADHARSLRAVDGLDALYQLSRALAIEPGVAAVWSATQPTGDPALLARGTLASQLDALRVGLGARARARVRSRRASATAEHEVGAGRSDLATKRDELATERRTSLLGAFAPGRFDAAARDLETTGEKLGALESGLGRAARGANELADGVARRRRPARGAAREPGATRLLDHLAITASDVAADPDLARALDHYVTRDGRAALFELRLAASPNSPPAVALAERLRERIPVWLAGFGMPDATVWLAGATAITAELPRSRARISRASASGSWSASSHCSWRCCAAWSRRCACTGFILASYFAALGGLHALVGLGAGPGVDWKAPFFLFVLLVAIGADYGVFVLGRARRRPACCPTPPRSRARSRRPDPW
jgi:RND superfamily putative drug exporter